MSTVEPFRSPGPLRRTWLFAAVLLLGSAASAGRANYLHWIPCRGSMLTDTLLDPFGTGAGFSETCLRHMDAGPAFFFPPVPEVATQSALLWSASAMLLAGLAWLVVISGLRTPWPIKLVASSPAATTLAMAVLTAHPVAAPDADPLLGWLRFAGEAGTIIAVVALLMSRTALTDPLRPALVVAGWGTTAFGTVHIVADYFAMSAFSGANWDYPPGTGYLTVAVLVVTGVAAGCVGLRLEVRLLVRAVRGWSGPGLLRRPLLGVQKRSLGT